MVVKEDQLQWFFDKKFRGSGVANEPNYHFASEFHRQIIRKFKRRKVYSSFKDNIWGVDCKVRPQIVNVNSDEPVFYPFSVETSKCGGSCKNVSDPYGKMCVPDVAKNLNVKMCNLMSRTNETRHTEWHET